MIGDHKTGHRFHDRNSARDHAWVVPAFCFQDRFLSLKIHGMLRFCDRCRWFERNIEEQIFTIADTTEKSTAAVAAGADLTLIVHQWIVVLRSAHGGRNESTAYLETFGGVDRKHGLR